MILQDEALRQQLVDEVHLQVLSLCYKITAAIAVFYSLFALLYAGIFGFLFAFGNESWMGSCTDAPPAEMRWAFTIMGLGMFVWMVVLAVLNWRTASCIKARRGRTFCQIMAGLNCLQLPYGTALGVCTFIVLARPSVAGLFARNRPDSHAA